MGYAVYEDPEFPTFRWAGYGVPAECDFPSCTNKIDRGMGYRCESYYETVEERDENNVLVDFEEFEREGCNLHFCAEHEDHVKFHDGVLPKPDSLEWQRFQLYHESWQQWRDENPSTVQAYISRLNGGATPETERTLLLDVKEEPEYGMTEFGNSVILLGSMKDEIDTWVSKGWTVAEPHFPPFGNVEQDYALIELVKEQWDELHG